MADGNQNVLITIAGQYKGQSAFSKFNSDVNRSIGAYKGLVGQVTSLNRTINVFGATIRQVGQGLQNLGTTMTAFLTLPVGAVFKSATSGLLRFDEQLIEIRKNAGLSFDALEKVKDGLVEISKVTPTPLTGLGEIAVSAGRAGLSDVSEILSFVKVVDQLTVATNLSEEESAKWIARLANMFLEPTRSAMEYERFLRSIGSAINELGQNVVATEQEIISATVRAAPSALAAGIPIQDLLGIIAALVESTSSAERVGTQANRAISEMASNAANIAEAAGISVDAFRDLLDSNPVEAFLGLAAAIGEIDNRALRAAASEQLFGQIGGKVVNILGKLTEEGGKVYKTLAIANKAFDEGTSLQFEFERALDSVTAQLGLMRNNLNVIAVTIGDVVLPIITRGLSFAIPVVRVLAERFDGLSDRVKLLSVGVALATIVIGPLLFALGSLMFSLGIITTGITTAVVGLYNLALWPLRAATSLLGLLSPMRLIVVAIGSLVASLVFFGGSMTGMINTIAGVFRDVFTWGHSFIMSFASGIASATSSAMSLILSFVDAVASLFESHSPPKKGPLKDIDKWGKNIGETFAEGFTKARMSGVLRFGGLIVSSLESVLRSISGKSADVFNDVRGLASSAANALGGALEEDNSIIQDRENSAIEAVANAVRSLVEAGSVGADVFDKLRSSLGGFAEDFVSLISFQEDYNRAVEHLGNIRKEQEMLNPNLQKEIERISALSGITAVERAAMIRAARIRRNEREKELNEQERAAEEQVDIARNSVEQQEALISSLIDALKRPEKSSGEESIGIGGINIGGVEGQIQSAREKLDEMFVNANKDGGKFVVMLSNAERLVRAFWDGLTGGPSPSVDSESDPAFGAFYLGRKLAKQKDELFQIFSDIESRAAEFRQNVESILSGDIDSVFGEGSKDKAEKFALAVGGITAAILGIKFGLPFLLGLASAMTRVSATVGAIGGLMTGINAVGFFGAASTVLLGPLAGSLGTILSVLAAVGILAVALWDMEPATEGIANGFELIWYWAKRIIESFVEGFKSGLSVVGVDLDGFSDGMSGFLSLIVGILSLVWNGFLKLLEFIINSSGMLVSVLFRGLGIMAGVVLGAVSWIGRAIGYVVDVFAAAWPFILDGLTQFADSFAGVWSSLVGWVGGVWASLVGWVLSLWEMFTGIVLGMLEGFGVTQGRIVDIWNGLVKAAGRLVPILSYLWELGKLVATVLVVGVGAAIVGVFKFVAFSIGLIWNEVIVPFFSFLGSAIDFVARVAVGILGVVAGVIGAVIGSILMVIVQAWGFVVGLIADVVERFVGSGESLNAWAEWFRVLRDEVWGIIDDLLGGLLTRISDGVGKLKEIFSGAASGSGASGSAKDSSLSLSEDVVGGFSDQDFGEVTAFGDGLAGAVTGNQSLLELPAWSARKGSDFVSEFSGADLSPLDLFAESAGKKIELGPLSKADAIGGEQARKFFSGFTGADREPISAFGSDIFSQVELGPMSGMGGLGERASFDYVSGLSSADVSSVSEFSRNIADALTAGLATAVDKSSQKILDIAITVSSIVTSGFADYTSNSIDYFDSFLKSAAVWILRKSSTLGAFGATIGSRMLSGLSEYVSESVDVFDVISDTFVSWSRLFFSGVNDIVSVARSVGEEIVSAVSDGIRGKSSLIGAAVVDLVGSLSLDSGALSLKIAESGSLVALRIVAAIGDGVKAPDAVIKMLDGLASLLFATGVAIVTGSYRSAQHVRDEARSIGILLGGFIGGGISGGRNARDLASGLVNSGRDGERDVEFGQININFNGGVVVDDRKRIEELAQKIAYEIGKSTSVRYRMGGVGV